jgi:hypothetical protein
MDAKRDSQWEIIRNSNNAFDAGYNCAKADSVDRRAGELSTNPYETWSIEYDEFQEGRYKFYEENNSAGYMVF